MNIRHDLGTWKYNGATYGWLDVTPWFQRVKKFIALPYYEKQIPIKLEG